MSVETRYVRKIERKCFALLLVESEQTSVFEVFWFLTLDYNDVQNTEKKD